MTAFRHARRLSAVAALAVLPLVALVPPASAAHESSNRLDFDALAGFTADGGGRINYVKGASDGTEDGSVWQQSLRFTGLDAGETYSVAVVKRADAICTFTASTSGTGSCTGRFLELRALAVAQLQKAGDRTVVAQATRTGAPNPAGGLFTADGFFTADAPGEITSDGGCREPEQGGSQCVAPGQIAKTP